MIGNKLYNISDLENKGHEICKLEFGISIVSIGFYLLVIDDDGNAISIHKSDWEKVVNFLTGLKLSYS